MANNPTIHYSADVLDALLGDTAENGPPPMKQQRTDSPGGRSEAKAPEQQATAAGAAQSASSGANQASKNSFDLNKSFLGMQKTIQAVFAQK